MPVSEGSAAPPGARVSSDLILGGLGLALAGFVWWMLRDLPMIQGFRVGAGYMPRLVVIGLVLTSLIQIVSGLRAGAPGPGSFAVRPLLFVCAALMLFTLLIEPLGLAPTAAVTVFVCAAASHEFRPVRALVLAAAITACALVLFTLLLGLPIKAWP